jgi:molybdopterin-guanine dinucleotide biosynthesis protein A
VFRLSRSDRTRSGLRGFVLAGGASSRFGSDKTLVSYRGRSLIDHALDALKGLGLDPRVVTSDPAAYRERVSAFVLGEHPGMGPAEGVRAALVSTHASWSLVLSADMPRVDEGLLRVLLRCAEAATPEPRGAVCFADGADRRHPFPGLYARAGLAVLTRVEKGVSMQRILDQIGASFLGPDAVPSGLDLDAALWNVNRPEDLRNPPPNRVDTPRGRF